MAEAETETEEWTKTRGCRKILQTLEGAIEQFKFHSRLAISDDLKVGFFTSDHATQTDCSEIFPLKDLTQSTEKLMRIITSLHVDFGFLKDLVQLKFEERLKEESWKIVGMLCDKMLEMKRHYQQGEDIMRKSFQQQLCDAIAIIKGMYQKYFEIEDEKTALQDTDDVKLNVLRRKLKEKEEIIKSLKNELELYEEFGFKKVDSFAKESSSPKPISEKELLDCRAENERLIQIITELEEESRTAINENAMLEDEVMYLKEISDQDQRTIQKLMDSRERLRYELDCEKLAIQDMINRKKDDIEIKRKLASISTYYGGKRGTMSKGREVSIYATHQTREGTHFLRPPSASLSVSPKMKRKLSSKKYVNTAVVPAATVTETTVTVPATAEIFTQLLEKPSEKHVTFLLPSMVPEELFLKYQLVKEEEKKLLENQVEILKNALEDEGKRLERFKKDADQANKNWEKKFLILKNSFHVLKNEMFTRQTLYRQCAMTGDTSFNYIKVKPLYVRSTVNMAEPSSPPNVPHPPMVDPSNENTRSDQVFPGVTSDSRNNTDSPDREDHFR
uniref:RIKEN cDNA 4921504E06 gene n=1 Tax=Mus spicilegus TaxID=10103 RepID=A0A8C6GYN7_MUSSI